MFDSFCSAGEIMFFRSVGTAHPESSFTQQECLESLEKSDMFGKLRPQSQFLAQRILRSAHGIERRSLALSDLDDAFQIDPDILHQRFALHAPLLAAEAARKAMVKAELLASQIDVIIISTCTGYLCPGLSGYVAERLGLRANVIPLDLVGQGCGAALPNLRMAQACLKSGQGTRVLSICVEVCSAAFYLNDDPGVLISACLFGDGAGAAILSLTAPPRNAVEWIDSETLTYPAERELLRFKQSKGLLVNVLSAKVPGLAAEHAESVLTVLLERNGLAKEDLCRWIWHGGGKNVLDALQLRLGLDDEAVRPSRKVLSEYGNTSSAFVYFVLEAVMQDKPAPGWWWMSSFGAGFSCHGALLSAS